MDMGLGQVQHLHHCLIVATHVHCGGHVRLHLLPDVPSHSPHHQHNLKVDMPELGLCGGLVQPIPLPDIPSHTWPRHHHCAEREEGGLDSRVPLHEHSSEEKVGVDV